MDEVDAAMPIFQDPPAGPPIFEDVLDLVEVRVNCEQNSLLFLVRPRLTGVCHTKGPDGSTRPSCYYRRVHWTEKTKASEDLAEAKDDTADLSEVIKGSTQLEHLSMS